MNGTFSTRLGLVLGLAATGALCAQPSAAAPQHVPLPKPRPPIQAASKTAAKPDPKVAQKAAQTARDILKPAAAVAKSATPAAGLPMQLVPPANTKHAAADPKGLNSFAQAGVGLRG